MLSALCNASRTKIINTAAEFVHLLTSLAVSSLAVSLPTCFPKTLSYYSKHLRYKGEEK